MALRRSARLRGRTPSAEVSPCPPPHLATPCDPPPTHPMLHRHGQFLTQMQAQEPKPASPPVEKLPAVEERDETAEVGAQQNKEDAPSTPHSRSKKKSDNSAPAPQVEAPAAKTPTTAGDVRPPHEEMHPSKARPSTAKQPDTGLVLGFNPVKRDAEGNIIKESVINNTPTKTKGSPPSQLGTPSLDLKFSCEDSQLSEEARKLMESIREDVSRIKAQMILDKAEQGRKEREAEQLHGDRKIAQPKGRSGRFSAAHMAEFKKMDSIENHPSAFRALPGRFQPVNKPPKRKPSKAGLDEPEKGQPPAKPTATPSHIAGTQAEPAAKRAKQTEGDDASTHRPKEDEAASTQPVTQRPKTLPRSSLMTPTKASAARAATVKLANTSRIPTLARSPVSKPTATTPRTPQTDFNPKLKSNIPTLSNLKSILRRHQPLFSNDPAKIAAGTHLPSSTFNPDIHMSDVPGISFDDPVTQSPSPKKRVEFTPNTKSPDEAQASPSPSKEGSESRPPVSDVVYPTLPATTPEKEKKETKPPSGKTDTPTIRHVRPSGASDLGPFPNLRAVPHGIINKKRRREEADDDKDVENIPPTKDSSSDERSSKRVKPNTPTVTKVAATPTPLKARPVTKNVTPGPGTPSRAGTGTPGTAKPKSKPVLTMSRLNMLAKPKERR